MSDLPLNRSLSLIQELDEVLRTAHQNYYRTNDELKKYAGKILKGDELKQAEELAINMEMIFRADMEPIANFISVRSKDLLQISHKHQEWREANIKANENTSIIDPNAVH
jgi:hypothetical protein